ncbi:MAG: hypothetical protein KUG77_17380 [Nannocystaceae bacterium]|nr:hypothetical protein [Nannocystaceae bacterium]
MSILDVLTGFFLMNAMPHFVLGIWKGRMLSLFGMSPTANILYGLLNFAVSLSLFAWAHGLSGLADHGIYGGALTVLVIYVVTARFWERLFAKP